MKALVTGGCGFIGCNLIQALAERLDYVVCVDNLSTGNTNNIAPFCSSGNCILHSNIDVSNSSFFSIPDYKFDVIYHLAAYISAPGSILDPIKCHDTNVNGLMNILILAKKTKAKVVFASSAAIYGNKEFCQESDLPRPITPYGATKAVGEIYNDMYRECYGVPTVNLRFFNVFGPWQSAKSQYAAAIPVFIDSLLKDSRPTIYGDGKQTRSFTYVEDVVRALILAGTSKQTGTYNISTSESVTINDTVKTISKILNKEHINPLYLSARTGDILHSHGSVKLAKEKLGFETKVSFEEGLRRTIESKLK